MEETYWPFSRARKVGSPKSDQTSAPVSPDVDIFVNDHFANPEPESHASVGADGQQPDVGEDEEGQEEFPMQIRPGPPTPTRADVDQHEATGHACYRCWCSECVRGRGRNRSHRGRDHTADQVPVISFDYGFLSNKANPEDKEEYARLDAEAEASGQSPVLCLRDRKSHEVFWYLVPRKGVSFATHDNLVTILLADLAWLGYNRAIFRSDGEPAIKALLEDLKARWSGEATLKTTAEGDHSSNGNAEGGVALMKGHVRTQKLSLERYIKTELPEDHNLLTWLVRHAASCYRKFHVGADGFTPAERVLGRRSGGPVAQFAESVWWMPLSPGRRPDALEPRYKDGHFLGYVDGTNTCLIATGEGIVRCRSINRKPLPDRWTPTILDFHHSCPAARPSQTRGN